MKRMIVLLFLVLAACTSVEKVNVKGFDKVRIEKSAEKSPAFAKVD